MGIHTVFLKHGSHHLAPVIAYLINISLQTSQFPDLLKVARLVPIYKKGNRDDTSNYRPLSILPLLSKLFEKYVDTHVRAHMDYHKLWTNSQYGFRRGLSAVMALAQLSERIIQSFSKKLFGFGFFIDVTKAFDSVNHARLLEKLSLYGITGPLLDWFQSYLRGRLQFVVSSAGPSQQALVLAGVPQGSVLGPLLFIIYINDLPGVLETMWPSIFADDTNMFSFSSSLSSLARGCSADLEAVERWFKVNFLRPSANKSHSLFFISPALRSSLKPDIPIFEFDGSPLVSSCSTKFLGIYFNSSLTWTDHLEFLLKKLTRFSGLFYLLRPYVPTHALLTLFHH
eukprot:Pompholyxophrys_punicea_v1_NODE_112_length_3406_cov_30.176067.p1 type:complete len:341 gc:universal NODE_112_length_3406_cov_30.176067:1306-284(-)